MAHPRARARTVLILAMLLGCGPAAPVSAADLHAFWDDRCAECHRHAGEFARNHLKVQDGRLVGRKASRDICDFIAKHGAGETLAGPICAMLTAQAQTRSLFKDTCGGCHGTAADLARGHLAATKDGTLMGKSNGREIGPFLSSHGGLAAGEIPLVVEALNRVYREVGGMRSD